MKINYFSPLLPAQSGISEIAELIIPALSQYAEVTAWTDQSSWNLHLEQYAKIRQYDPHNLVWSDFNRSDLNIYHLGNNIHYHHGILELSHKLPGLVVLHDIKLHHLFCGLYCALQSNPEGYIAGVEQYYGPAAGLLARQFLMGEVTIAEMEDFAMTEWAIDNAGAVLVHNRGAFTELAQQNRWVMGYQPLPYHAPPLLPESQTKTLAPPYRLIIFGHIGHNRRVEAALQALAELPNKDQFLLDIYGSVNDEPALRRQIEQCKLKSQVKLHGFVSDEVLDRALANAHLAINLRYPTMGEASLSQLRIWRHALPSLVTQVGWYAEQSEEAVLFVRPDHEIADIQNHLQRLVHDPTSLIAMGARGRQILEADHAPDAYARALIEFAKELPIGYQQSNTRHWLQRVGQEIALWKMPDLGDQELSRVAEAIYFLAQ
jgi:glycosyltransferase involved in cell wall biosynthesis